MTYFNDWILIKCIDMNIVFIFIHKEGQQSSVLLESVIEMHF